MQWTIWLLREHPNGGNSWSCWHGGLVVWGWQLNRHVAMLALDLALWPNRWPSANFRAPQDCLENLWPNSGFGTRMMRMQLLPRNKQKSRAPRSKLRFGVADKSQTPTVWILQGLEELESRHYEYLGDLSELRLRRWDARLAEGTGRVMPCFDGRRAIYSTRFGSFYHFGTSRKLEGPQPSNMHLQNTWNILRC